MVMVNKEKIIIIFEVRIIFFKMTTASTSTTCMFLFLQKEYLHSLLKVHNDLHNDLHDR